MQHLDGGKSLSNEHNVGIATEVQAGLGPQPSASLGVTFAGLGGAGLVDVCLSESLSIFWGLDLREERVGQQDGPRNKELHFQGLGKAAQNLVTIAQNFP